MPKAYDRQYYGQKTQPGQQQQPSYDPRRDYLTQDTSSQDWIRHEEALRNPASAPVYNIPNIPFTPVGTPGQGGMTSNIGGRPSGDQPWTNPNDPWYGNPPASQQELMQRYGGGETQPPGPFSPVGTTPTQRPGGQLWSDWGHAGQQVAPGTVQQEWVRPDYAGGHIIWNDLYGYQDYPTIEKMYASAQGPVTQEQFGQWGLTPQFNPWQSYEQFAGRQTYGQQQQAQQGGYGAGGFGGRMEASGLPTPWQWGVTGDVLGNIAQGGANIGMPDIWQQGAQGLGQMMQGGMPTDVSGIYGAQLPVAQRYLEETGKGLAEQFGMGGMRYSTPFQARLMEETGRMGENLALSQAQAEVGAQEAARGRMMGAYGQGLGYGGGMAGLQVGNINRQMQAANQLWGQGMGEVMYPMNVAQGMAGLGQGMFNQQSQQIQQMLNDPYLMAMMGMAGNTGFGQQQYQPSPLGTGLDIFSSMYPWLKGQQSTETLGYTPVPPGRTWDNLPF